MRHGEGCISNATDNLRQGGYVLLSSVLLLCFFPFPHSLGKVRDWAGQYSREVEAVEKRPHDALLFARAVADGSSRVLGSAAELLSVHSAELAGAEASAAAGRAGDGLDAMHWKAWRRDGLDALGRTLGVYVFGCLYIFHVLFVI